MFDSSQASLQFFDPVDGGHDHPVGFLDGLLHDRLIDSRLPIEDDSNIFWDLWKLAIIAKLNDPLFWQKLIDRAVDVIGDNPKTFLVGNCMRERGLPLRALCPNNRD